MKEFKMSDKHQVMASVVDVGCRSRNEETA
jgi:hypothetical protein